MQIKRTNEVLIVQSGSFYLRSCQLYRLHVCNRCDGTCASYLIRHIQQACTCSLSLIFVCYCPSRTLGGISQALLLADGVDFQHHAVSSHSVFLACCVPTLYEAHHIVQRMRKGSGFTCLQSPCGTLLYALLVGVAADIISQQVIQIGIKMRERYAYMVILSLVLCLLRILHELELQCPRCRITRVGKCRLTPFGALLLQLLKVLPGQQHFASHLKLLRIVPRGQLLGYLLDILHVLSNIVSLHSVTSRHSLYHLSVAIGQRDRQSVIFQFTAHVKRLAIKSSAHLPIPFLYVLAVIGVGQ